jgi:cytochrome c oxidase subunit II
MLRRTGLASLVLLVAGCSSELGAPESASAQGDHVVSLWRLLLLLATAVGAIVLVALLWSIVRYRARSSDPEALPDQNEGNVPLELAAVALPLVIVAGIFVAILVTESRQDAEAGESDVVVEVTSYRWGWRFHYVVEGEDVTVSGGPDEVPVLVLPVDRNAQLELSSADVVHSFFVPSFLVKRDTFPDADGTLRVRPTRTGEFDGYCAEFCGLDHAGMDFIVRVEDDAGYEAWLDEQRAAAS